MICQEAGAPIKIYGAAWVIVVTGLTSNSTLAQEFVPPGQLIFDGIPVACGVPAVLVGPELGDIAKSVPGQILINWATFSQFPTGVKMFVYGHECGHQVVGPNENAADKFSIDLGRQQGWVNLMTLQQICQSVYFTAGDWTHMPGPARCQAMYAYFQSP